MVLGLGRGTTPAVGLGSILGQGTKILQVVQRGPKRKRETATHLHKWVSV